jgi:hypothetical protein
MAVNKCLAREVDKLRGACCRRIMRAASSNDVWSMRRYSAINIYLYSLIYGSPYSPLSPLSFFRRKGRVIDRIVNANYSVEFISRD